MQSQPSLSGSRSLCRSFGQIADAKELADKAIVGLGRRGQMGRVMLVMLTKLTGGFLLIWMPVMMEGQHKRHLQHY